MRQYKVVFQSPKRCTRVYVEADSGFKACIEAMKACGLPNRNPKGELEEPAVAGWSFVGTAGGGRMRSAHGSIDMTVSDEVVGCAVDGCAAPVYAHIAYQHSKQMCRPHRDEETSRAISASLQREDEFSREWDRRQGL